MPQLKRQLIRKLEQTSGLTAKLANGPESILPTFVDGVFIEASLETATPFITVTVGQELALDTIIGRLSCEIYVYDDQGKSYWAIDRIINEIRKALEAQRPQFTPDPGEQKADFYTEWEYTSAESRDDELKKAFKIVRMGIWV